MYLGLDIGTSGVKAIVLAHSGNVAGQAHAALQVSRLHSLWSEQDPQDWWAAVEAAVLSLDPVLRAGVRAIGLSGQMHGATLLGADDKPLRPAILWNDGRSFAECAELEAAVANSRGITGNLAMPGFTAPKLLWVRNNEPELFSKIRTVLLPKDYVRLCMTGDKSSDMADAAGTLWLDVAKRDWSDPMLAATGLSRDHMPKLFEGCEVTGQLRSEIAQRWGMGEVPVVAGGGDCAASAAGIGMVRDGDAMLSLGTSGVIFVSTAKFLPNPEQAVHAFCHCVPEMWHQMSVHLSAASCIDWGALLTGTDVPGFFARAEEAGAGAGPELFLPYLSGERTPHNNPHARGAFLALDNNTNPARLAAAVLEGVAFAHADGLNALREAGTNVEELCVVGGAARSRYWGTIMAAVLNVRLTYLNGGEVGAAMGAARLAQMADTGEDAATACVRPPISHVIEPDSALADRLASKAARFRQAYQPLCTIQE